jgi:hypothetical protein
VTYSFHEPEWQSANANTTKLGMRWTVRIAPSIGQSRGERSTARDAKKARVHGRYYRIAGVKWACDVAWDEWLKVGFANPISDDVRIHFLLMTKL